MVKLNLQAPASTLFVKDSDVTSAVYSVGTGSSEMKSAYASNTLGGGYSGYYWGFWEPYREYHHDHYHYVPSPDKYETAFKLARELMKQKLVRPQKTIEDFFKLMDVIVATL